MRMALTLLAALLFAPAVMADSDSYPRKHLLVEPPQLLQASSEDRFVILDARPREDYESGHIPGAHWIDADEWKNKFDSGSDAADWSERIGRLGLTPQNPVVVYDGKASKDAARIWWILRFWGVQDARLLNGGWTGWQAAEAPIEQEIPEAPTAVSFPAQPNGPRLATKSSVLEALENQSLQIVDARSESEFCGIEAGKNRRAGAIPGAKHLDWSDLIDHETQRFKPAPELQKRFDEAGIALDKPAAAHCQSGGRSSVMVFAMELMGAKPVQNYYAGWSEWGNTDETPVVKPEPQQRQAPQDDPAPQDDEE